MKIIYLISNRLDRIERDTSIMSVIPERGDAVRLVVNNKDKIFGEVEYRIFDYTSVSIIISVTNIKLE